MIRKIIKINEELCNGCGLCVDACHEGAIGLVNNKAILLRDDYCDGLGDCLPVCPMNAIHFEEREALPYNEEEVKRNMEEARKKKNQNQGFSCPGSRMMTLNHPNDSVKVEDTSPQSLRPSMLRQWPVQIQLVPVNAPYFNDANLLIAADCTAFSYGSFHDFMKNKITLIGCPKLDDVDYSEKLTQIIANNNINSITVIRMEVPCCGGLVHYVKSALAKSGKVLPWKIITISTDGKILED